MAASTSTDGPRGAGPQATAAVLAAPQRFELQRLPIPALQADDALLRVEACGLCGTDYEQWRGGLGGWGAKMPIIPGHEAIGWIEAIGPEAARSWQVREGDRVAIEPVIPCGHCRPCVEGEYTRCEADLGYGLYSGLSRAPGLWGGYATHMYLHPRSMVHRLPGGIPSDVMTLFNPLSNAIRWVCEVGGVGLGSTVVIEGAGQRALLGALAARDAGATTVIVTGLAADRARLALARQLGATHTIDVDLEDPVERVREITGGALADVVVEMSAGATKPILDAIEMARRGGRIVLAGLKGEHALDGLLTDKIVFRELQIIGVLSAGWRSVELAIDMIRRHGSEVLQPLCSHAFALEQAERAVRTLGRIDGDSADAIHVTLAVAGRSA